jgi:CubicO group peptidase (beta-lactamase class C family)
VIIGDDRRHGLTGGDKGAATGLADSRLSRRRLVGGLVAGAAVAVLAACTRGVSPATPMPAPATPAPGGTPTVVFTPPGPVATPTTVAPDPGLWAALGERIEAGMRRVQVPGVAVGVLAGGEERLAGFGMTTEATARPVDPDVPFMIGSVTKTFTGTALMRLVERGALALDTPVRAVLPDLRLADEAVAQRLTLRHLVTHTAGWWGDFASDTGTGDDALARFVALLGTMPQVAPLGQFFSYCNAGIILAGRVLEAATGQTYEAAMGSLLFAPLGLTNTSFARPTEAVIRIPVPRNFNPSAAIAASIRDLLRYARFHLGDGAFDGARLLSRESLDLMQTPLGPGGGMGALDWEGVGVTWRLRRLGETRVVQHDGGVPGYASTLILVPARQFAIALVANTDAAYYMLGEVATWALEAYLGLTTPAIMPAEVAAEQLAPYAGRYAAPGYVECEVQPAGGKLSLSFPLSPQLNRPFTAAFYAPDRAAWTGGPGEVSRIDFVRRPDGAIGWLRNSGRLLARQPD